MASLIRNFDNGKIRISLLGQIPLVEIYHHGELDLADVQWANHVILRELPLPAHRPIPAIINKTGSYSLNPDAAVNMEELMKDASCVAYVCYSPLQEQMVEFARNAYLNGKLVANFHTVNDAHAWISKNLQSSPPLIADSPALPG
jgi:hypothetical protein